MKPKIKIDFVRLNDPGLAGKGKVITSSLTNNHFYPEPFSDYVSSLAQIDETIVRLEQAFLAGLSGDKQKIAARKAIRKELIEQLTVLARYCDLVAKGNLEMLMSTGFDIRKDTPSVMVKTANTRIPVVTVRLVSPAT